MNRKLLKNLLYIIILTAVFISCENPFYPFPHKDDVLTLQVKNQIEWNRAVNAIYKGGIGKTYNIVITGDIYISSFADYFLPTFNFLENINITITGNHLITLSGDGCMFYLTGSQTLILHDVDLAGSENNYSALVRIGNGASVIMKGTASISGNYSSNAQGGGVCIEGGSFIMEDSSSVKNNSSYYGGGVYLSSGLFIMKGGSVSGNYSDARGGGLYIRDGNFQINNGIIYGENENELSNMCVAHDSGIALYLEEGSAEYGAFFINRWSGIPILYGGSQFRDQTINVIYGSLQ